MRVEMKLSSNEAEEPILDETSVIYLCWTFK